MNVRPLPLPLPLPVHTTLAALDISAFGSRLSDLDQIHLRRAMYELLEEAFKITTLPWGSCHREDRGDGTLIVAPSGTPAEFFLDPLAHHLNAGVRRYNRRSSKSARLRLRMAVHAGPIRHDLGGVAGRPTVHLFRLLDCGAFRRKLTRRDADLGLIVSDALFEAVRHDGLVDSGAYRPVRVRHKETRARAWVWLPHTTHRSPFQRA